MAAIVVGNIVAANSGGVPVTNFSFGYTIAATPGNARLLVSVVGLVADSDSITCTYRGSSLTKVTSGYSSGVGAGALFMSPTNLSPGSGTVVVTFGFSGYAGAYAAAFHNVHPTEPYLSGSVAGGWFVSSSISRTIPTRAGGLCVDGFGYVNVESSIHTVGAGQTTFGGEDGPGSTHIHIGSYEPGTGGNVTMSWTLEYSRHGFHGTLCLLPSGGGNNALIFG